MIKFHFTEGVFSSLQMVRSGKPCPLCGKVVQRLNRHLQDVHIAEKRYRCSVCQGLFSQWSNMRQHMESKHGLCLPLPNAKLKWAIALCRDRDVCKISTQRAAKINWCKTRIIWIDQWMYEWPDKSTQRTLACMINIIFQCWSISYIKEMENFFVIMTLSFRGINPSNSGTWWNKIIFNKYAIKPLLANESFFLLNGQPSCKLHPKSLCSWDVMIGVWGHIWHLV